MSLILGNTLSLEQHRCSSGGPQAQLAPEDSPVSLATKSSRSITSSGPCSEPPPPLAKNHWWTLQSSWVPFVWEGKRKRGLKGKRQEWRREHTQISAEWKAQYTFQRMTYQSTHLEQKCRPHMLKHYVHGLATYMCHSWLQFEKLPTLKKGEKVFTYYMEKEPIILPIMWRKVKD